MKTIQLAILLILMTIHGTISGQKISDDKVPTPVFKAFTKAFPNAIKTKWEIESANVYESNFKWNKTQYSAKYDQNGTLQETEMYLTKQNIPITVMNTLKQKFAGFKIEAAEKVTDGAGKITFELAIEKGKKNLEVKFDPDGKLIKQEEVEEGKD